MKKFLAVVLALVLALTLVACGGTGGETGGEAAAKKVGVCIYKFDDNFMTLYRQELETYMKSLGDYEITIVDGKGDMNEQTNQVDTFIAQGVDVLIVNLVNSSSAATITEKAKAADIPVVYINREPSEEDMAAWDKICYVGADARQSGTYQGEIIAELPDHGDVNGNGTIDYVMIIGDPENIDAQYRTEFSIKALTDAGYEVNELLAQRGDWEQAKGQEIAATALSQFGNDIDVIFCNNDGMALGAYQAIVAADRTVGTDIYLVGVDALDECVQMVKDGTMTGTVLNDHIGQSHAAVDAAIKYLNGEANDKMYVIDYQKVTV